MQNLIKGRTPYVPNATVRIGYFASGRAKSEGLARLNQPLSDLMGCGCQFWSVTFLASGEWSFRWIWPVDVIDSAESKRNGVTAIDVTQKGSGV